MRILRGADVTLDDPLTAAELARVEVRLGFTFAPDHARLLSACLPTGESWPHWRDATEESLRAWLDLPTRGVLFDVSTNNFWPTSWGPRPPDAADARAIATIHVRRWPRLVPLYAHRFMAAGPRGRRVFSVHQTDVISYGDDVVHHLRREFVDPRALPVDPDPDPVWPWSDLAAGAADVDL